MRLKVGNILLNRQALKNIFWILFFVSIYVGVGITLREDGKPPISLPLTIPFFIVVAKLIRSVRQEIANERAAENKGEV